MSYTSAQIREVAVAFAGVLRGQLTAAQWHEMKRINALHLYRDDPNSCSSHEVCDANMAMYEAVKIVLKVDDLDFTDEVLRLFNEAWLIAKKEYLTAVPA